MTYYDIIYIGLNKLDKIKINLSIFKFFKNVAIRTFKITFEAGMIFLLDTSGPEYVQSCA